MDKTYTVIGLMSGTSLDGIDAALIRTDGKSFVEHLDFATYPYDDELRATVRDCFGMPRDEDDKVKKAEELITQAHIDAVKAFGHDAELIGFHGQTIFHDPANRMTWQIGDGQALANATGIDTVYDFRSDDVKAGGQGAPLIPLYHRVMALSSALQFPCAIVNIGGVANLTWIGEGDDEIVAFDTGPGNALIDDWMLKRTGSSHDTNGDTAAKGKVDATIVQMLMAHPYFGVGAPKSLDRNEFASDIADALSLEDGAATLTAFTIAAIVRGLAQCPVLPRTVYVTGGGRHNGFMMQLLAAQIGCPIGKVDDLGWNGDAMEAEGFAYLAMRSVLGLPLSLPMTTGCPRPMTGGRLVKPVKNKG